MYRLLKKHISFFLCFSIMVISSHLSLWEGTFGGPRCIILGDQWAKQCSFINILFWLNDISDTGGIIFEDIVFRYGDTVYRKQMQRFAKIFELCVQSIISGGVRVKGRYVSEMSFNQNCIWCLGAQGGLGIGWHWESMLGSRGFRRPKRTMTFGTSM